MNVPMQRPGVRRDPARDARVATVLFPAVDARRPSEATSRGRWTIRGALVGVGPDGRPTCTCMQSCDSEGNCSPCYCEPAGCGTCE
jgi:hypothetical protein